FAGTDFLPWDNPRPDRPRRLSGTMDSWHILTVGITEGKLRPAVWMRGTLPLHKTHEIVKTFCFATNCFWRALPRSRARFVTKGGVDHVRRERSQGVRLPSRRTRCSLPGTVDDVFFAARDEPQRG